MCVCVRIYVRIDKCICVYIFICVYICMYVCMYVCVFVWMHAPVLQFTKNLPDFVRKYLCSFSTELHNATK